MSTRFAKKNYWPARWCKKILGGGATLYDSHTFVFATSVSLLVSPTTHLDASPSPILIIPSTSPHPSSSSQSGRISDGRGLHGGANVGYSAPDKLRLSTRRNFHTSQWQMAGAEVFSSPLFQILLPRHPVHLCRSEVKRALTFELGWKPSFSSDAWLIVSAVSSNTGRETQHPWQHCAGNRCRITNEIILNLSVWLYFLFQIKQNL